MLEIIHDLFRILALSQVLLLLCALVIRERHALGWLTALTLVSVCSYLVLPILIRLDWIGLWLPSLLANMIPALLWLLAYWFFQDRNNIPLWLPGLTLFYMALFLFPLPTPLSLAPQLASFVSLLLPQMIKLGLVVHALFMAMTDYEADLVDDRRALRRPVAVGGGLLAALVILVEIWAGESVPALIDAAGAILMFLLALAANTYLFTLRLDLGAGTMTLPESATITTVEVADDAIQQPNSHDDASDKQAEAMLLSQLQQTMTQQRLYATHSLTLSQLAKTVGLPVHRLRKLINGQLGYRNFNQYLNALRVNEASARLIAEDEPVLTIALDVGFRSVSSFSQAFRQQHNCTPTEYRHRQRQQKLSDS